MTSMRDRHIDCISGIMILFMIYRHCLIPGNLLPAFFKDTALFYPLMFFMAWFFFKGGLYYPAISLRDYLKKSIDRLLIPYVVFSLIALVVFGLCHLFLEGNEGLANVLKDIPVYLKREGAIQCNSPLWFLLSLFFVRLFFSVLQKLRIPVWITLLSGLVSGWFIYHFNLPIGIYFGNIALGLSFFSAGHLLKDRQYLNPVFIISALVYSGLLVFWFFYPPRSDFHANIQDPYFLVSLYYLAGIILINNVFKRLTSIQSRFLSKIGRESMTLFVTHFIFISTLLYLNEQLWRLKTDSMVYISMVTLALFLPPLVRLFKHPKFQWMIGERTLSYSLKGISERVIIAGGIFIMLLMVGYLIVKSI